MAHEITAEDGLFTVRQQVWHGLGQVLEDYPTREEAQKIAHPWDPVAEPVYRKIVENHGIDSEYRPVVTERYEEIPDQVLNARSDTGAPLGVVSKVYGEQGTVTNTEMYDVAEAIQGEAKNEVMYETGGSLGGGRKVWLLIRLREPIVIKGDPRGATIPYYALQNAHDGSGSFRGQGTNVRICCANSSRAADMDASLRNMEFVFRHTATVHDRIEEAKMALYMWRNSIIAWQHVTEDLVTLPLTSYQQNQFIETFVPMPPPHMSSVRVEDNVYAARNKLRTILRGETCEGIALTAYGLVAAAMEYHQHYRKAKNQETRFKRAYLDKQQIITDAVSIAREVALG